MLDHLTVRDFALVEDLSLPFHPGLTVLTGETGAGKSLLVDALQAALGERVDAEAVRRGAESALVEAAFTVPAGTLPEGEAAGDELVVSREVRRGGKGRISVNGGLAAAARLRELGEGLVDLHGQHEHQTLLRTSTHLLALDGFAGLEADRAAHAGLFTQREALRRRIAALEEGARERSARGDYLRFVVGELEAADPREGEEERLREEERVLSSAERLLAAAGEAVEAVYASEDSAADRTARSVSALRPLLAIDSRLGEAVALLESAHGQLGEAAHLLRDYLGRVEADPARLETVGERLALLASLRKKYGPSTADVMARRDAARRELEELEGGGADAETLRREETALDARLREAAAGLSRRRRAAAGELEAKVRAELADLAMEKVRFQAAFADGPHAATGTDAVEFLFSANPGEPPLPLRRIASGGELSRVMLALKRVLAASDAVPTLVFDEVDAGIGGRVAAVLGRKLREISRHHQVLCVTHLAQVAACADHHLLVEKSARGGRTLVTARYLDREERVRELARMMGGLELTSGILESARELLEGAHG